MDKKNSTGVFQEKLGSFSVCFADGYRVGKTGQLLHNLRFAGQVYQYSGVVIVRGGYGEVLEY
jgi:hypothetical protein